jgi:uncharacterized protein YndB with AHSA1/START domain
MPPQEPSLTLVRRLGSPPSKVYAAWTDPDKILRWWGPDAGPTISAIADVRVGGRFEVMFRTVDGKEHTCYGIYREVIVDRKLVFTWRWRETPDHESMVTILLEPTAGGTELTLIHEALPNEAERDSHRSGWNGALDKLNAFVA